VKPMTISKKDEALRYCFEVFYAAAHGAKVTKKQFQLFADLCALTLPMRHRWTGEELEVIRAGHFAKPQIADV